LVFAINASEPEEQFVFANALNIASQLALAANKFG
jgi:hypothetical protein